MKLLSSAAVRRCLIADPGYAMFSADFDQIELRVAAALAGETSLIEAAKRGESLHKTAAVKLFGTDFTPDEYRYTKNVNFGWLFGGGAYTLSRQAGIPIETAAGIIKQYGTEFPALTAYKRAEQNKILQAALSPAEMRYYRALQSHMFNVRNDTPTGRREIASTKEKINRLLYRKIGYTYTPFGRRLIVDAAKAYSVVNYKVQSSARDIMGTALLDLMADGDLEPTLLLIIHDEFLGQAPIAEAEQIAEAYGEIMTRDFLGVPISATGKVYGKSWGHGYR